MKKIINNFSDYASTPEVQLFSSSIGDLIRETLALYRSHPNHHFISLNTSDKVHPKIDKKIALNKYYTT